MARGACGLNGFQTVFWPFYAFRSPGRPVNIWGQKGGKIGFLVVLEALGGPEGKFLYPQVFTGEAHANFPGETPGGKKKCVFNIF